MSQFSIVIGHRGFMWIGEPKRHGDDIVYHRAVGLRRWGTTQGLGELVSGPTPDTILDFAGTVRFHPWQIIATIDLDDTWDSILPEDTTRNNPKYSIVIAHRGFMWIGAPKRQGEELIVTEAKGLRRWGTTQGLGQLYNGPTSDTVLDLAGTVRLHLWQVIATLDLADSWAQHLND